MLKPGDQALFDVIVICDMCVDLIVTGDDVVPQFGQVEKLVGGYILEMGGSCGIFACQAAKLGLKVSAVGMVGADDFGALILRRLAESGVDIRSVSTDPAQQTGIGIALCQGNDRAILTYSGTICAIQPEHITDDLLRSARHIHHGSYYLQQQLLAAMPDIFRRAHAFGLTTSLDTNWDPSERWRDGLLEALLQHTDIFMPNEQEALRIAESDQLDQAIAVLHQLGPSTVVVKRGERSAVLDTGGMRIEQAVTPVTGGDSIGAGDSFDAGYLYARMNGYSPADCLKVASYCGSSVAAASGGLFGQPTHLPPSMFVNNNCPAAGAF